LFVRVLDLAEAILANFGRFAARSWLSAKAPDNED
jgi:hypothetical protein